MEGRSLQDLLKLSLKLSDQELREWPENYDQMDNERKVWLKEAIENALKNDDVHKLRSLLQVLQQGSGEVIGESRLEEISNALDGIHLLLDSDHNATDLHLLGGLKLVTEYLSSNYSSLRWRAAEIIADATQHKPICQQAFTDLKGIEKLVEILHSDDLDIVKIKCVYALSCVTKNCEPALTAFLNSKGLNALLACISNTCTKLTLKASFMLINLIMDDEAVVPGIVATGAVQVIIDRLSKSHDDSHEHLTHLLYEIISRNKDALLQCQATRKDFNMLLSSRINELSKNDAERYQEEIFYCQEIITLCSTNNSSE